ncbi:hypothetical protein ONZ45_g17683 [Pleurotus djamor]|nr:hypothetical protein ONZ45_g17683 [Pleurotus djamor]
MGILTNFAAQRALDEEIATHEAIIRNLKARRNTHSAACKLPDEILSLIFVILKSESVNIGSLALWSSILGVCHHWRQIILNTPMFWSWICLADPKEVIETSMKLSRSAPLCVVCPSSSSWGFSVLDLAQTTVEAAGSRIKRLTIDLSHYDVDLEFTAIITEQTLRGATALQALRLSFLTGNQQNIYLPISMTSSTLSLQVLELSYVLIPINPPQLPSLKKLHITYHDLDTHPLSLSWVIQCLSGSPNLEEVKLATIASTELHGLDTPSVGPFPIALPHLRSFHVSSEYLDDSQLFRYLEIPPSAQVTASYANTRPNSPLPDLKSIQHLFSMLGYGARSSALAPLDKMLINLDDSGPRVFGIKLYKNTINDSIPLIDLTMPLILSAMESYIHLCSRLPLYQVTELTFANANDVTTSSPWSSLLPAFTNLTRFGVQYCNPAMQWAFVQSSPPSNIFLETFCETDQQYSELDLPNHPTDEDLDSLCEAATQGLKDADDTIQECPLTLILLKARRDMGLPFRKYVIKKCVITATQVETLRRFVEVEWDGMEDGGEFLDGDDDIL